VKKLLLVSFFIFLSVNLFSQKKVFLAEITGEIDPRMAPYISRVVSDAENDGAEAIIFRINTFGGRVDAATQIKDAIIGSRLLTIAFINNRAISAGSLIALSCRKICMVPGSSIGAATVVDQSGQKQSEKYQSFMRSEMRSTAERNGRRTDIVQGMVDENIIVPGINDHNQLITLTSDEAKKYGIADTLLYNLNDCLSAFGLRDAQIIKVSSNWAEDLVGFLNQPLISSILIMLGLVGIFAEIKSPGFGFPVIIGVISLLLFFGSSYILQLASIINIVLFIIGIILLLLEIFVIPGFAITGVIGIILIIGSIFLSLIGNNLPFWDSGAVSKAIIQLSASLLFAFILIYILAKFLPKSSAFSRLVLSNEEKADQGFVSYPSIKELMDMEGIALTTLRPAGSAEFNGQKYDVVADWEYIPKGNKVKVIRVEGIKVVVKELKG
jgi:membrane-bound serine protease (ClpP class)